MRVSGIRHASRWRAGLLLALPWHAAAAPEALSATQIEPRAFGYTVGDVLQRRIVLHVPDGLVLDRSSLPPTRRPGQPIELRAARLQGDALLLDYQVFVAPVEVRTFEVPPFSLRFAGPAGEQTLRVDAWPVTVAPLVPVAVSPRTGLGEMRPDTVPPLIDTAPRRWRLAVGAALLLAAAAYLTHVYVGLPWRDRGRRPFASAWRELRALPAVVPGAQRRAAMVVLHHALNRSAGEVLFEEGLPAFVRRDTRFAPLQGALTAFFRRSHDEFFAQRDTGEDLRWLLALCRACRDAERGSA